MEKTRHQETQSNSHAGFTLIEALIVVAIIVIVAAVGVPSYSESLKRNRVAGAAEEIYGMLVQARSDGMLRDVDMAFSFNTTTDPWCAGYSVASNCDCTISNSCTVDTAGIEILQSLSGGNFPGVTIRDNFATDGTTFDRIRGTASHAGTISVRSDDWQLNIVVSNYGRMRICNPNHSTHLIVGFGSC